MAATLAIVKEQASQGNEYNKPYFEVVAKVNFGNPYGVVTRATLLALLNVQLATIRHDLSAGSILAVMPSNSEDGQLLINWDETNGRLEGSVLDPGAQGALTPNVLQAGAFTAELAAAPDHTFTLPAGSIPIFAEGIAGFAGPLFLQFTAGGAAGEASYDPATGIILTRAADTCTAIRVFCLSAGAQASLAAGTAPSIAAAAGDQSAAAKSFSCYLLCGR
jgi:hypothetical protein